MYLHINRLSRGKWKKKTFFRNCILSFQAFCFGTPSKGCNTVCLTNAGQKVNILYNLNKLFLTSKTIS